MSIKVSSPLKFLIVLFSIFPIALFAYLGQFSRLMSDDYCIIAIGHEYGGWGGMTYWYENWEGSYSALFFRSFLAPLDQLMPAIMPVILIGIWVSMLTWLLYQIGILLTVKSPRVIAIILACLTLFVTINGFHSLQSFYWYTAMVEYTFPLALLTGLFALILYIARQVDQSLFIALSACLVFLLSFLIGGFAESHSAFQVTLFALMTGLSFFFLKHSASRKIISLFTAGTLGTLVSLIVQVSSPGLSHRFATELDRTNRSQISLFSLIENTISLTFKHTSERYILGGFVIILVMTAIIVFLFYKPVYVSPQTTSLKLPIIPILTGVTIQLLFIPFLWSHTSDVPQILGRFSYMYFGIIVANIVFILLAMGLLANYQRINRWLLKHPKHLTSIYLVSTIVWSTLFGITQVVPLDERVIQFIMYSLISFLLIFISHLVTAFNNISIKRFAYSSWVIGLCVLILSASIISASVFGTGGVIERILPALSYSIALFGLVCGFVLGTLLKMTVMTIPSPKMRY
jgi:hypothetical protein